jgi:hypothetical protein
MNLHFVFPALAILGCPLVGQTVCAGKLIPLKPAAVTCANAAPICVTNPNEIGGHWVWGCPTNVPSIQSDPTIPLRVIQPRFITPGEAAAEAERLRELRLKNQEADQQSSDSQNSPTPDISLGLKALYSCGVMDGMLKEALMLNHTDAVNQLREQLKMSTCDDIRKAAGVAELDEQLSK